VSVLVQSPSLSTNTNSTTYYERTNNTHAPAHVKKGELRGGCGELTTRLATANTHTLSFVSQASELKATRDGLRERAKGVTTFLDQFRLTEQENHLLQIADLHTERAKDNGVSFFAALTRVEAIRTKCRYVVDGNSKTRSQSPQKKKHSPIFAEFPCF
jgi:hypothetical protein